MQSGWMLFSLIVAAVVFAVWLMPMVIDKVFRNTVSRTRQSALAILLVASLFSVTLTGCTDQQKQTTVQVVTNINAQIPAVIAGADTVAATLTAILPADALIIGVSSTAFDTAAKLVQSLTTAYLANPNADTLTQLQTAVATLEASVNTATLNAVKITNPTSQALALAALKGLLTVVSIVFGMIQATMTKAQVSALAATNMIHLALMRKYMDERVLEQAANDYLPRLPFTPVKVQVDGFFSYEAAVGL